ncbi:hypothetical protein ABT083_13035 [Streptomyces goshikiensis]|uniref:hypothetical protein n=1 Tax=Streptomyces goshikiensis TaxID=1942 RepID=UPI00332EC542
MPGKDFVLRATPEQMAAAVGQLAERLAHQLLEEFHLRRWGIRRRLCPCQAV